MFPGDINTNKIRGLALHKETRDIIPRKIGYFLSPSMTIVVIQGIYRRTLQLLYRSMTASMASLHTRQNTS